MRHIDVELELRSIRRGGLQHLASRPNAKLDEVLLFSRHSDKEMLRRYLDHGLYAREEEDAITELTDQMLTGVTFPE